MVIDNMLTLLITDAAYYVNNLEVYLAELTESAI
jgi:hypothetical protein